MVDLINTFVKPLFFGSSFYNEFFGTLPTALPGNYLKECN